MTHNELAARIERAEGPDRALDGEVAIALGILHPRDFIHPLHSVPPAPAYTSCAATKRYALAAIRARSAS